MQRPGQMEKYAFDFILFLWQTRDDDLRQIKLKGGNIDDKVSRIGSAIASQVRDSLSVISIPQKGDR